VRGARFPPGVRVQLAALCRRDDAVFGELSGREKESVVISVVRRPGTRYPGATAAFAPSERYPEYRFGPIADEANPVYGMVRELFTQLGLDGARAGTAAWNPLGEWIRPDARVFVLSNFVYHRRPREGVHDFHGKVVHGSVLRALIDYVLIATGEGGKVLVGNAPLQSCRFDDVLAESGTTAMLDFYRASGLSVEAADLRAEVVERDRVGRIRHRELRSGPNSAVEIDLGADSLLDGIGLTGGDAPHFRVSDYNPDRTEGFHARGSHRYVMAQAVLASDTVISVPKLKTHEKVGITCAVKGFVGAVARKDCLAHHRFGSPAAGGDEYPARLGFLKPVSHYHDWVNRRSQDAPAQALAQVIDVTARRALRRMGADSAGAWYGNDTAWRMAVDLARIVHHADANGVMRDAPQRRHLALIDGIVAGEGAGPLSPTGVDAASLIFADGVLDADLAACRLMGFDPADIATLRFGATVTPWALPAWSGPDGISVDNGARIATDRLAPAIGRSFVPPRGWRGHLGDKG
jgi:uncharacterized protein (DUF362 family)